MTMQQTLAGLNEWNENRDTHKPNKITQWTVASWDHADNWNDADWRTIGASATCSRGVQPNAERQHFNAGRLLSMSALSVGDERQRSEQDEVDNNQYHNRINKNESWVLGGFQTCPSPHVRAPPLLPKIVNDMFSECL